MYTLNFLAPILVMGCANNFLESQGEYCNLDKPQPNIVKYYETGKSCYKNGIFYEKCEDANGTF
jgi:hypothetical protein